MASQVEDAMACENEKWKQFFLRKEVLTETCCLFADVTALDNDDERMCVTHGRACVSWLCFSVSGLL